MGASLVAAVVLTGVAVSACGPWDGPAAVEYRGERYEVVAGCLPGSAVVGPTFSVDPNYLSLGDLDGRALVAIPVEDAIAVQANDDLGQRCPRRGWVSAVRSDLSEERAERVFDALDELTPQRD